MALFGTNTSTASAASNTTGDITKDVALNQPPEDSISDLSFSPTAEFLAVSSWDNRLRIYEVSEQGQSQGKAEITFGGPVLSCSWSHVSSQRQRTSIQSAKIPQGWHEGGRRRLRQISQNNRPGLELHGATTSCRP